MKELKTEIILERKRNYRNERKILRVKEIKIKRLKEGKTEKNILSLMLLPLLLFFIIFFSFGGMNAFFLSSCFLLRASACFTFTHSEPHC